MTSLDELTTEQKESLSRRLGESTFEDRLRVEAHLAEKLGDGRSLSKFSGVINLYSIIRWTLKLSGLWRRAVQNYLDIQVFENAVPLPNLPSAFEGYRILHITDLHADLHPDFVPSVQAAIRDLSYDLILITGDFRSATYGDHSGATREVIRLAEVFNASCYCVLGNHDTIAKVPRLEAAGMQFLLNEHAYIERDGERLWLVGIDDPNHYKTHDFARALDGVPADACKILLSHSPETYQTASELGFALQLSGHTHAGQICLPGGWVLVHDGTSPRHLLQGAWREGHMLGYTGRGTGATGLPVRLNCPAEVTLHILHRADNHNI